MTSARERVYQALKKGPATRPELAKRTGLSGVAVITAVEELQQARLAALDEPPLPGQRGRPASQVRLLLEEARITAVDLGGPQVLVGAFNLLGERQQYSLQGTTRHQISADREANVNWLCDLLECQGTAHQSVIGVLGRVDPETRRVTSRPLNLQDDPLEEVLSDRLGWPVRVENDANLAAWHHWTLLSLRPRDPLVFLNFSYGIELGLVLGGQVYCGARGAAGELAYAADPNRRNPTEVLASRLLGYLQWLVPEGSTTDVAAMAHRGDRAAQRVLQRFNQDLAVHLTSVVATLDPKVLVLQDLPLASELLRDEVRFTFAELGFDVRVLISPLGPLGGLTSAGAFGAQVLERTRLESVPSRG
ncbi:ROK family transcriptional regulator [Deinococcus cellulosilyticus]|uniref:Sugar kinase n=1 Tax=Deinococcus cellulosilyticus (strain DSM 18568 / NBRC 106333 / KACC 11606 / 5516J-15) TaxID=1223518 RepID=A0A511MW08_DEIC1|nr:ROK family protein [Deinococcus cellulosilyticus]GEM44765.1 sugar kinase [Deinococcus cellulosilyticus NBRC 106333 = KACC 11606]